MKSYFFKICNYEKFFYRISLCFIIFYIPSLYAEWEIILSDLRWRDGICSVRDPFDCSNFWDLVYSMISWSWWMSLTEQFKEIHPNIIMFILISLLPLFIFLFWLFCIFAVFSYKKWRSYKYPTVLSVIFLLLSILSICLDVITRIL